MLRVPLERARKAGLTVARSCHGPAVRYVAGLHLYDVATTSGVVSGFFGGYGTSAVIVFALP
jgi:hypothetical protein